MDIMKCDCGRAWCEFFDAAQGVSYTREQLEFRADELADKLKEIRKALRK